MRGWGPPYSCSHWEFYLSYLPILITGLFLLTHMISSDHCLEQMKTQKYCLPMSGCYVTRKISFVLGLRNHWFFRTFAIRKGKMSFWFVTYPAATRYLYVHSKKVIKLLLHFKLSVEDIILS